MDAPTAALLLTLAEDLAPAFRGAEGRAAFDQLDERYGDLPAAIDWFIAQGRAAEGMRLATALVPFWMSTKRLADGSACLDRLLAAPGGGDRRARALYDAGYLAFWQGEDERSAALFHQAVALGRQTNDPTVVALALAGLARIALRTDVEAARALCREALAVTEGTADRQGRSSAMHVLAVAAQMAGDLLEARQRMSERIALAREEGNLLVISSESGNLSMVERQLGNLDEAEALARAGLEIDVQRGDEWSFPHKLNGLAAVAAGRGEFERAARLIGSAEAMVAAQGAAWPPDERPHYERVLAVLSEALGPAAFERARAAGQALPVADAVAYALG